MKIKNIFALGMSGLLLLSMGCGTKAIDNPNEKETVSNIAAKETEKPVQETKEPVQPTRNPMQVTENTLIFSCKANKKNTPGYQKVEDVCADTFYVSDDIILLDDTVNQRILVYENGEYVKSIDLDWNRNVKQMFFSKEDGVIKTVYENLNIPASEFYTCDIDLKDGRVIKEEKIGDSDHVLLHFYFREDGKLMTDYLEDKENENYNEAFENMEKLLSKEFQSEICFSDVDEKELLLECSNVYSKGESLMEKETILRSKNGEIVTYAVPQEHKKGLNARYLKYINGNIYELSVTEDKVEIYVLAEKEVSKNKVECLERVIR